MTTLKKGANGAEVRDLQRRLNCVADGIFGSVTEEAVKAFQREHGLTADGIVGERTWTALGVTQTARKIDKIIVHCSATPEGEDYTVADIRAWHLARGFADIGYHYVVYRDGSIHAGRAESKVGAHCTGQNAHSIGVCYVGGCPPRSVADWQKKAKDTRTEAQRAALARLVGGLARKYGASVHGHRDFAQKSCPSFDVHKERW